MDLILAIVLIELCFSKVELLENVLGTQTNWKRIYDNLRLDAKQFVGYKWSMQAKQGTTSVPPNHSLIKAALANNKKKEINKGKVWMKNSRLLLYSNLKYLR